MFLLVQHIPARCGLPVCALLGVIYWHVHVCSCQLKLIKEFCPDMDFLGVNSYGEEGQGFVLAGLFWVHDFNMSLALKPQHRAQILLETKIGRCIMSQRSFVRACHQTDELLILIFGGLTYTVTYIVKTRRQYSSNRAALAPIKCGASCVGHASLTSLLLPPHLILRRERECKVEKTEWNQDIISTSGIICSRWFVQMCRDLVTL